MNRLLPMLGPLLAVLGVLFVVLFDTGRGLDSPGIWLIPLGLLIIAVTSIKNGNAKKLWPIGIIWFLAFLSILGLYFHWFTPEGFDAFIWIYPAAGFTVVGIILLFIEAYRNVKLHYSE